jgi:FMN phosphatase YigB (HAD superfamily)
MKEILLALDIGNVCVRINHANFASALGEKHLPEEYSCILRDYEWGNVADEDEFIKRCYAVFDGRFSESKLLAAFETILIEAVPGMQELAAEFGKMRVKAVFFSDISLTHLRRTRELVPVIYNNCAGGVFSFDAGAWKPSEAMFARFEKLYGVPDLYVDDRSELIEAAQRRSWNASLFTSAEDLREKLRSLS